MKTLDVGCGGNKMAGAFGVDLHPFPGVDLVHDLDEVPWPLDGNQFDRIIARHIIEHVRDPISFLNEIHRIAKPGAMVEVVTPHYSNRCAYTDPTHRRYLSARAFDFFTGTPPRHPGFFAVLGNYLFEHRFEYPRLPGASAYSPVRLHLSFGRIFRLTGIAWLANRFLDFYEFYCAWVLPARDLTVTLRVEKP